LARQLAAEGVDVALVARNEDALRRLADEITTKHGTSTSVHVCDVRDPVACRRTFQSISEAGPFDLLIYSSGIMPKAARDGFPTEEDVAAIETNFSGAVVWINEAAQYLASRRSGTIVGIGSVAGDRGRQGHPVYNATKAALASYLESMRGRLRGSGVSVVTIKPGFVRTPMIGDGPVFPPAATAERAAHDIIRAARRRRRVAYVPSWWILMGFLLRHIPAPVLERIRV
jgi:short-subunit dehydrogenase